MSYCTTGDEQCDANDALGPQEPRTAAGGGSSGNSCPARAGAARANLPTTSDHSGSPFAPRCRPRPGGADTQDFLQSDVCILSHPNERIVKYQFALQRILRGDYKKTSMQPDRSSGMCLLSFQIDQFFSSKRPLS